MHSATRRQLNLLLAMIGCAVVFSTNAYSQNPLLVKLVEQGAPLGDGNLLVKLPKPILASGMTASQQTEAIKAAFPNENFDRFLKKSVVGPFDFNLKDAVESTPDGSVQRLHLGFIAHGKLAEIENRHLFDKLAIPVKRKASGPVEEVRALTAKELEARSLKAGDGPEGSTVSYGVLKMFVIDKVYLSSLTYSCGKNADGILSMAFQTENSFKDDPEFPTRWYSVKEDKKGDVALGEAVTYPGVAGYATATQLLSAEDAILVEIHLAFLEPKGWFGGRNALRSKLPILMQDAVRSFRRKLAGD